MSDKINFKGLEVLGTKDSEIVRTLADKHLEKLTHKYENITSVDIHIKISHSMGVNKKYSISVELTFDKKKFSSESIDWNIKTAVHDCFNKIDEQISKEFKS